MDVLGIVIVLGVILVSMILHELAHGLVAYALGDTTAKEEGRLTLNPIKHIDPVFSIAVPLILYLTGGPIFGGAKPVPVNSRNLKFGVWGMALVAIAGPLTNFILALVSFLIGYNLGIFTTYSGVVTEIFANLVMVNLGFFVFNILPIPPLDGSRVLYAIAPDGAREVMERIERTAGLFLVLILVVVLSSVLSRLLSGMIGGILDFFYMLVGIS
ncbi:site-2 protease family protein [Candidatus Saccharibacteria bacterium]|nr:site-2 protease family protein [Candidatus Saccharibacteria bacterium]